MGRRVITLSSEGTYVYRYNLEGQLARVYFSYKRIGINTDSFDKIYDSYDYAGNGFDLIEMNVYNNSGIKVYTSTPLSDQKQTLFYQTPFGYLGTKDLTTGEERLLVNYLSSMSAATANFESVTQSFGNADGPSYQSGMSGYNGGQFGIDRAVMNQKIPVTQDMQPLGELEEIPETSTVESILWATFEASSLTMTSINVATGFDRTKVLNYYRDQIGSVRMVTKYDATSDSIKVVWGGDYTAYGEILTEDYQMTWLPLKTFALHEYDRETGLYYAQARWYDPETASFTSEDGAKDGLNWYAYCSGSPLGSVDPSGMAKLQYSGFETTYYYVASDQFFDASLNSFGYIPFGSQAVTIAKWGAEQQFKVLYGRNNIDLDKEHISISTSKHIIDIIGEIDFLFKESSLLQMSAKGFDILSKMLTTYDLIQTLTSTDKYVLEKSIEKSGIMARGNDNKLILSAKIAEITMKYLLDNGDVELIKDKNGLDDLKINNKDTYDAYKKLMYDLMWADDKDIDKIIAKYEQIDKTISENARKKQQEELKNQMKKEMNDAVKKSKNNETSSTEEPSGNSKLYFLLALLFIALLTLSNRHKKKS